MILIATTVAQFVMDDEDTWGAWLYDAEELVNATDESIRFFAAIEKDARGIAPFKPLIDRLEELDGEWWRFELDDKRTEVTTDNRLRHITTGQNICSTVATERHDVSHMLFVAADCQPPTDVIPRLLETGLPYIGPRIDTYGEICRGPKYTAYPWPEEWGIEDAMPSAACMLLAREVFTRLRWRVEAPHSDDPCYQIDARDLLGIRSAVRTDIRAQHYPEAVGDIATRGHDMTVVRS